MLMNSIQALPWDFLDRDTEQTKTIESGEEIG